MQFVRQVQATARQHEREVRAAARRSERYAMAQVRAAARLQKDLERENAAAAAEQYTTYLTMLNSLHVDCSDPWDWHAVRRSIPPIAPAPQSRAEAAARGALAKYSPGFVDRLFGGANRHRAQLEEAVQRGIAADQQHYAAAMHEHGLRINQWNYQMDLATGVLSLQLEACRAALRYIGAFDELENFRTRVTLDAIVQGVASFSCASEDEEIVPSEEVKLTASGKLSTKEMAAGKYWALFQDHLASCAIRIAREAYAVTPIDRVIVNVKVLRLDPSTGHMVRPTVLAVHFTRGALMRLNFAAIDPSEALKNFAHRMKFKKTTGFDPVEDITPDDQWVTT
jgi:hypothetical protein